MDRKVLVATVVIAILVLSLVITPSLAVKPPGVVERLDDEIRSHVTVILRVYKNGELVREKVGDPVTDTWIKAILSTFFLLYRQGLSFTCTDGTTKNWVYSDAAGEKTKGILAIGTDQSPASTSDYKLYATYMRYTLDSTNYLIQDNANWINVTISHTFIVNEAVNIAEAGLILQSGDGKQVLVCRDSFTPVSLNPDDGITIEYNFNIRKDPPFTEYFWGVIINVFLGYRGSTGSYWHNHKFLTYNSGRGQTVINSHKLQWAYVLSDEPWSPTPTLASTSSIRNIDLSLVSWSVENQSFNLHIRLDELDQNMYEAYGIAIYTYVCTGIDSYNWAVYSTYLVAYIRYPNPPITANRYTYHIIDLGVNFNV